ncbi:methyltransferase domain-containing protein [Candidatus Altiarchaeota archaeon]
MKRSILGLLACPECKGELSLEVTKEKDGDVIEGAFSCSACGKEYVITNHIPRFVPSDMYVESFSFEWSKFRKTQLDSHSKLNQSYTSLTRTIGIKPSDLAGEVVLDAGCGTGRHIEVAAPHAKQVIGVDLSQSVDIAQELVGANKNVNILQADLNKLPFKDEVFDRIYSIGVIQHTPDTKQSFLDLTTYLKKGGSITIWIITDQGLLNRLQKPFYSLYRFLGTRLPHKIVYGLCHLAVPIYWIFKVFPPIIIPFPIARHPTGKQRILDTFDIYTPKYLNKHSAEEAVGWYEGAGFSDVKVTIGGKDAVGKKLSLGPLGTIQVTIENPAITGQKP